MAVTMQYFDAGHAYGLDSYPITLAQQTAFWARTGAMVNDADPWPATGAVIGKTYTLTSSSTNGFSAEMTIVRTSSTTLTIYSQALKGPAHEVIYNISCNIELSAYNLVSGLSDTSIFSGADKIIGNSYNNTLMGFGGNDQIDGGAGTDTALYSGYKSQYQVTHSGSTIQVTGPDGADVLSNVERVQFADRGIAFDTDGASGQAYRLYQAAFNRKPDLSGLGYYFTNMDKGMTLNEVAQHFIDSPEFSKTYGKLNPTQFVTQLYANVLHRAPDAAGLAYHVDHLNHGLAQNQLLVQFSESPENQVALIGTIQGGMEYTV